MLDITLTINGRQLMHGREFVVSRPDLFPDKSIFANPRKFASSLERSVYEFVYRSKIVPESNKRASVYVYLDSVDKIKAPAIVLKMFKRKRPETDETETEQGLREFSIGDISVQFRSDGYVNATKMCKDSGKEWKHYKEIQTTRKFLDELSRSVDLSTDDLISTNIKGANETRGTFVHPDIAINLAQWISPAFAVSVSQLVRRYATGKVTTHESKKMASDVAKATQHVGEASQSVDTKDAFPPVDTAEGDSQPIDMNKVFFADQQGHHQHPINKDDSLPVNNEDDQKSVYHHMLELVTLRARLEQHILQSKLEKQTLEYKLEIATLTAKLDQAALVAQGQLDQSSAKAELEKERLEARLHNTQQTLRFKEQLWAHETQTLNAKNRQAFAELRTEFLAALWRCRRP